MFQWSFLYLYGNFLHSCSWSHQQVSGFKQVLVLQIRSCVFLSVNIRETEASPPLVSHVPLSGSVSLPAHTARSRGCLCSAGPPRPRSVSALFLLPTPPPICTNLDYLYEQINSEWIRTRVRDFHRSARLEVFVLCSLSPETKINSSKTRSDAGSTIWAVFSSIVRSHIVL